MSKLFITKPRYYHYLLSTIVAACTAELFDMICVHFAASAGFRLIAFYILFISLTYIFAYIVAEGVTW